MRTKTLLIAAAALAAAVTSSQAQTVYSQNIVGYANLALSAGNYELLAPAFDADGTGTNGTITSVVGTNIAVGTSVLVFNGTGYDSLTWGTLGRGQPLGWTFNGAYDPTYPINVGEGFWMNDPSDTNLTVSGTVLEGAALTNEFILSAGNYSLLSSQVPFSGGVTSVMNYQPTVGDSLLIYNGSGYNAYTYGSLGRGQPVEWTFNGASNEPNVSVGQGFWLQPAANNTWVETFTNN
jgi:hypothetical protein